MSVTAPQAEWMLWAKKVEDACKERHRSVVAEIKDILSVVQTLHRSINEQANDIKCQKTEWRSATTEQANELERQRVELHSLHRRLAVLSSDIEPGQQKVDHAKLQLCILLLTCWSQSVEYENGILRVADADLSGQGYTTPSAHSSEATTVGNTHDPRMAQHPSPEIPEAAPVVGAHVPGIEPLVVNGFPPLLQGEQTLSGYLEASDMTKREQQVENLMALKKSKAKTRGFEREPDKQAKWEEAFVTSFLAGLRCQQYRTALEKKLEGKDKTWKNAKAEVHKLLLNIEGHRKRYEEKNRFDTYFIYRSATFPQTHMDLVSPVPRPQ
jgi:hypothetical protein